MGQQGQSQSGDHSLAPAWIMGLIVFVGYFAWHSAHQYIVSFVFAFNIVQAKLINYFVHDPSLGNDILLMQTLDPAGIDWQQLMVFTQHVGDYSRYPIMVLMLVFAIPNLERNLHSSAEEPDQISKISSMYLLYSTICLRNS
jgi:intracellular multiplication protein IcmP